MDNKKLLTSLFLFVTLGSLAASATELIELPSAGEYRIEDIKDESTREAISSYDDLKLMDGMNVCQLEVQQQLAFCSYYCTAPLTAFTNANAEALDAGNAEVIDRWERTYGAQERCGTTCKARHNTRTCLTPQS